MAEEIQNKRSHYPTLVFIGAGAMGVVQFALYLIMQTQDSPGPGISRYLLVYPAVYGIVSAILAPRGAGNAVLNALALGLIPVLYWLLELWFMGSEGFPGDPTFAQTMLLTLLLTVSVSAAVFFVRTTSRKS